MMSSKEVALERGRVISEILRLGVAAVVSGYRIIRDAQRAAENDFSISDTALFQMVFKYLWKSLHVEVVSIK